MGDFNWILVLPVVCLAAYGLLAMILSAVYRGDTRGPVLATLVGLVMTGVILVFQWRQWTLVGPQETAFGLVRIDGFGLFFSFILLIVTFLSVLMSIKFLEREGADLGEFYALMLFCLAGMFLMLHTTHLMMVLIGLEVFSLALYVVCGLTRGRIRSVEAALKYFLLGAFSSGFMVYGMALLYGAAGTLDMGGIGSAAMGQPGNLLLWVGMALVLIGLAFKIAVVPFHQWVPDVYTGAPTNVTGFMAAATKTVAFAVLLRFLIGAFGGFSEIWIPMIFWLAVLTMTIANLVALAQTNMKRLLAFSSIAHAGYVLIAVVSNSAAGVEAIMFYLAAYALMTVGAFAVLVAVGRGDAENERGYTLSEWAGLGWSRPMLALAMTLFMFSMAGIPPTGGFFGKYVVFKSAMESQQYILAVIGVLNAAIAAFYYLKVIMTMYMREPEGDELPLPVPLAVGAVMLVSVVGTIYLGIAPEQLLEMIRGLASTLI
jgi:NADH-quinone oxidoreductase subunit N